MNAEVADLLRILALIGGMGVMIWSVYRNGRYYRPRIILSVALATVLFVAAIMWLPASGIPVTVVEYPW